MNARTNQCSLGEGKCNRTVPAGIILNKRREELKNLGKNYDSETCRENSDPTVSLWLCGGVPAFERGSSAEGSGFTC